MPARWTLAYIPLYVCRPVQVTTGLCPLPKETKPDRSCLQTGAANHDCEMGTIVVPTAWVHDGDEAPVRT